MKTGETYYTPRFCSVKITEMFGTKDEAVSAGYTEPTHYEHREFGILGKSLDIYHMVFAGYKK